MRMILWELVEDGFKEPDDIGSLTVTQLKKHKDDVQRHNKAISYIYSLVSEQIFPMIVGAATAKEAWEILQKQFQGSDKVRQIRLQTLRREFETLKMKETETIKEYSSRVQEVTNQMRLCGEIIPESRIVEKILITVTDKFDAKVSAIEESRDVSKLSVVEVVGSLQAHEQRLLKKAESAREEALQVKNFQRLSIRKQQYKTGKEIGKVAAKEPDKKKVHPPCGICGRTNHEERFCWKNKICTYCKKKGHIEKVCRNKPLQGERNFQQVQQQAKVADVEDQEELLFMAGEFKNSNIKGEWYIDSGCTSHMANEEDSFTELDRSIKVPVKLANGEVVEAEGKGSIRVQTPQETCEEVLIQAEELHIVSRCINSLAMKACADPSLFSWPVQGCDEAQSTKGPVSWNGICTSAKPHPVGEDWWHDDVSFLRLPLYKRQILAVGSHGMKPEGIAGAIIHYSKRHLSLLGRDLSTQWGNYAAPGSTISATNEAEQRNLLEEIVELVPEQKGVTPSKFLLRLLRTAILINASPSCRETLEKRIGAQLDQAALEDLLIPSTGYSVETLYDIDCVQRILDHFMLVDSDHFASNYIEEEQLMESSHSLTPVTMVANLMGSYLAEVAPDVNLKPKQFQSLAAAIPDYARPVDDGIYRAIDIYLKAHPWLTESEREQLCRLMSCQKFSLEASTHAAQNERLPLRVIIQVLFFEQLRLRTSISSWFFVSDNLENSQNASGNLALTRNDEPAQEVNAQDRIVAVDAMKKRVCELEKECSNMKQEIDKLVKTKGGWNTWLKKLGFSRQKPKAEDSKVLNPTKSKNSQGSSAAALLNGGQHQNGLSGD